MPEGELEGFLDGPFPSFDLSIPPEAEEYARTKVGENPETRTELIEDLKELIYQRGDVTPIKMDDDYLIRFLRARNFKLEPAYRLLVTYYQFREENLHLHHKVNPMALQHLGDANIINVMGNKDQHGRRIFIFKFENWVPRDVPIEDIFKGILGVLEAGILEPSTQILGGVTIFDFEGFSLQHVLKINPSVISKTYQLLITSFPVKVMAIHVINESWIFEKVFAMFKPLINDKGPSNVLFFHGSNLESLHKHIPPEYLPEQYGGTQPHFGYLKWFLGLIKVSCVINGLKELGYDMDISEPLYKKLNA